MTAATFGRLYGDSDRPSFVTDTGIAVWMWRKGQRVRFLTAEGTQVGPEHRNVFPAVVSAYAAGWSDPSAPEWLNRGCQAEVQGRRKLWQEIQAK